MGTNQQFPSPYTTSGTKLAPSLGALLHTYRAAAGETAKAVSRRSTLGPVEIAQVELGRADLTAEQLADAVAAYAIPRRVFPEGRCQVHVDLAAGWVSVEIGATVAEETSADRIVLTYFELMFAAAPVAPTTQIPLTALDLHVLRVILSSRRNEVTAHLRRIVGPMDESAEIAPLEVPLPRGARNALLLVAAALTTFAGVIVVRDANSARKPAVAPIEVRIIDALVVTRETPK